MSLGNIKELGLTISDVKGQAKKAGYFFSIDNKDANVITFFNRKDNYIQIDSDGNIEGGAL